MTLAEAKDKFGLPAVQATWTFLLRGDDEVLLAMKKRGFGEGKWNAPGGKAKPGETLSETAARETLEEVRVEPLGLVLVAVINFYFVNKPEWSQTVTGFVTRQWVGEPHETEEMSPRWFKYSEIPYDQMWSDDSVWLPKVLAGQKITGDFLFGDNNIIIDHNL